MQLYDTQINYLSRREFGHIETYTFDMVPLNFGQVRKTPSPAIAFCSLLDFDVEEEAVDEIEPPLLLAVDPSEEEEAFLSDPKDATDRKRESPNFG